MGLFGGGNSATSNTTNNSEATLANYGDGIVSSNSFAGVSAGGNLRITTTDHGAIKAGTKLSERALSFAGQSRDGANSLVQTAIATGNAAAKAAQDKAFEFVTQNTKTADEKKDEKFVYLAAGFLLLLGVIGWRLAK